MDQDGFDKQMSMTNKKGNNFLIICRKNLQCTQTALQTIRQLKMYSFSQVRS
mgnify:CR=1 FL=1